MDIHAFRLFVDQLAALPPSETTVEQPNEIVESEKQWRGTDFDLDEFARFAEQFSALLKPIAPIQASENIASSLETFLQGWQQLDWAASSSSPIVTPQYEYDVEMFGRFIETFSAPMKDAIASGARMNVWAAAGLKRDERRIAGVLAWLLDHNGDHGLGSLLCQAFLENVKEKARRNYPNLLSELDATRHCYITTEYCPFDEQEDRIDIHFETPSLILFLEVKVDAGQGVDQLNRYHSKAQNMAALRGARSWGIAYLTCDGKLPEDAKELQNAVSLSWRELGRCFHKKLKGKSGHPALIATQYVEFISNL